MTTLRNLITPILVAVCVAMAAHPAQAYRRLSRWTRTASSATAALGDPATLTWSLVPDGTSIPGTGDSSLISFLDTHLGSGPGGTDFTQRPWFHQFEDVLNRWSELSGLTYIYEPFDDGVPIGGAEGMLGTRGDIRIAAGPLDGPGGAYGGAGLPNDGDMVLDTDDEQFLFNPFGNYLGLRQVLMHENGHALGLGHIESDDAEFLMEPFPVGTFDGPQLDDIRGAHRLHGDFLEKSNGGDGNDRFDLATPLGALADGESVSLGLDSADTFVDSFDIDFLSIDDNTSDTDFFSFSVSGPSAVDIILSPVGPTYNEAPQGLPQVPLNSQAISDLTLAVNDTNGLDRLETANSAGLGQPEEILGLELPAAGQYYVRVTGAADDVQLYRLDITVRRIPEPSAWVLWVWGLLLLPRRRLSR